MKMRNKKLETWFFELRPEVNIHMTLSNLISHGNDCMVLSKSVNGIPEFFENHVEIIVELAVEDNPQKYDMLTNFQKLLLERKGIFVLSNDIYPSGIDYGECIYEIHEHGYLGIDLIKPSFDIEENEALELDRFKIAQIKKGLIELKENEFSLIVASLLKYGQSIATQEIMKLFRACSKNYNQISLNEFVNLIISDRNLYHNIDRDYNFHPVISRIIQSNK